MRSAPSPRAASDHGSPAGPAFLRRRRVRRQPALAILLLPVLLRGSFPGRVERADRGARPASRRRSRDQWCHEGDLTDLTDVDDDVVGWCNAHRASVLHALDDDPVPAADTIGAILCYIVPPQRRGQGIARHLLAAACDGLKAQGLRIAEANPRPHSKTPADQHYGPLSPDLSAGFTIDRIDRIDADGCVSVRKPL